ncbi:MAG: glycosyltransferase family 2 protein, partial [Bacteroidota bacterium]|nr:glycosyltransferase family 2 protein [Bacteroidota bacterium]
MEKSLKRSGPLVTVLTSVYNGEEYLREAIESILNQSFTDYEFLIVNDGSTDKTAEILAGYFDPRIRIIHNNKNKGLSFSLNSGLEASFGVYVARQDADDISLRDRLRKQVDFMEKNPQIHVCGTWFTG